MTRALGESDLPALVRLSEAYDTHWFGKPESDADEVREGFEGIESPLADSLAVTDNDDRLVAAVWRIGTEAVLSVDPADSLEPVLDQLLPWIQERALALNVLSRDGDRIAHLQQRGWAYDHSAFELIREVTPDWQLARPEWPGRVVLRGLEQPGEVHDLIYRRAGWAGMVGHGERDLAEWQRLFLPPAVKPEEQIVAWEGREMVGVALGRIFSDGAGWVSQLAVPVEHRGRGLGRALLLEVLGRQVAAGTTRLGLQVSADNQRALALYLDVGLVIDREWREFRHRPRR